MYVALEFKVLDGSKVLKTGVGRTLNLSSSGILFECDEAIPVGTQIRLSLDWPAQLNEKVGLRLCVNGRAVRSASKCTAVEIMSHEFRTRPLQQRSNTNARVNTVAEMRAAAGVHPLSA